MGWVRTKFVDIHWENKMELNKKRYFYSFILVKSSKTKWQQNPIGIIESNKNEVCSIKNWLF